MAVRMKFMGFYFLICILSCLLIRCSASDLQKTMKPEKAHPPNVTIGSGAVVIGKVFKTADRGKRCHSFRKIPFGKPPTGKLRFKPPIPLPKKLSNKVINASRESPTCVQFSTKPYKVFGREDCLYLNVYRPEMYYNNDTLLPVMVYIYGGFFVEGRNAYKKYGADYLLNEDVIVVVPNYRVGVFGFLSTEDEEAPGNIGLQDQLLALKWTQENIAFFGGDPNRVTAFGQGSGAACLSYLSQSPLAAGLFHRVILESGTSLNLWALTRTGKAAASEVAQQLNITPYSSGEMVEKLRSVDYRSLQKAATTVLLQMLHLENTTNGLPFGPTIEPPHPEAIIVNKSYNQLSNKLFHKVPYLIGFNTMEAIPITNGVYEILMNSFLKYAWPWITYVPASLYIKNDIIRSIVDFIVKIYYKLYVPSQTPRYEYKFTSDDEFVRPILQASILYSRTSPVYLYLLSYKSPVESYEGIGHGAELRYLWRRTTGKKPALFPSDLLTRRRLIRLWTNFAKTGNPTPVEDPLLQNITWPSVRNKLSYLNISSTLIPATNPLNSCFTFWEIIFTLFGNPPYSTY